jgi:hypothetical protein
MSIVPVLADPSLKGFNKLYPLIFHSKEIQERITARVYKSESVQPTPHNKFFVIS